MLFRSDEQIDQRTVTISAQPLLFLTDTFVQEQRTQKHYTFLQPDGVARHLAAGSPKDTVITFLDSQNTTLMKKIHAQLPDFQPYAPGPFVILTNTRF